VWSLSSPKNEALIMETKLRELTVDERIKLVEDLWDSIAADRRSLPIAADQRIELDPRLNAYAVDKKGRQRCPHGQLPGATAMLGFSIP
jgi:putative addiction module component (TIGR02574 family)